MKKFVKCITMFALTFALVIPAMAADTGAAVVVVNGIDVYTSESGSSYVIGKDGARIPACLDGDYLVMLSDDGTTVYVGPDGETTTITSAVTLINGVSVFSDAYGSQWTHDHHGVRCPVTIMGDGRVAYLDSEHNMVYHFSDGNFMVLGAITETRNSLDLYADWDGNLFTDEDGVRCYVTEAKNGDLSYVAPNGELVIAKPNGNIIRAKLVMPEVIFLSDFLA